MDNRFLKEIGSGDAGGLGSGTYFCLLFPEEERNTQRKYKQHGASILTKLLLLISSSQSKS